MKFKAWNPGTLLETAGSYWEACTLHAGVVLDLFSAIGDGELTGEQVAEKAYEAVVSKFSDGAVADRVCGVITGAGT